MRSAIPAQKNCDLDSLEDIHFLRAGEKVNLTINNVNEGVFAMVVGTGLGTLQGFELRKLLASIGRKNRYVSQVQTFIKRNSLFVFALTSLVLMTEIFVFRSKKYIQFGKGVYDNSLRIFEISLVLLKPISLLLMKYVDDLGIMRLAQVEVDVNQLNTFANQLQNIKTLLLEDSNLSKCKNAVGGFLLTKRNTDDQFCLFKKPIKKSENLLKQFQGQSDDNLEKFMMALGCCNNSAKINNICYGNKRDTLMIKASGFDIQFQESSSEKLDRIFSLASPALKLTEQRVLESDQSSPLFSVIVEQEDQEKLILLTKGDPTLVKGVCEGESIPLDFEDTVRKYSNKGFRLMALCAKELPASMSTTSAKNVLRNQLETKMTFLGIVLFKKKVNSKSEQLVRELHSEGVQVKMMSSQNMHDCLNTASHSGVFSSIRTPKKNTIDLSENRKKATQSPLILGTTSTRNKVEKLVFSEYKIKNQNHLEPKEKSVLDLTSPEFILSQNVQLCLTGRAFQLLVSENKVSMLKAIIQKTRIFAELDLNQREAIINASVGVHGEFEKTVYVQSEMDYERGKNHSSNEYKRENVFNDLQRDSIEENFSRNADLSVNVAFFQDLHQELTSNCSLNGDLLGLSKLVSQGKDLATLNRQLVDFLLFTVWIQLLGLFLLYTQGVSMSKTEFFFFDILFVFGIASLLAMSIRHQKKKKRVRGSLLISPYELDRLEQEASDKIRKSNLLVSCFIGAIVLYICMSVLWRQASYASPSKMDKTNKQKAQENLYPDSFVVFSTLCWLNLCYFFLNIFTPVQYKTVQKYRSLLYSLGLLCLLFYFQGLTLSKVAGPVSRILHIPYLGIFAVKQIAIILVGFLVVMVLARLITTMIVNKSLIKHIQLKETRILESHIQQSQNLEDLGKIDSKTLANPKKESAVIAKLNQMDLDKLEKESRRSQTFSQPKETQKVYRFVMKEGDDISVEMA
jgi:magnesium-transporting ATPase (P-type)